MKTIFIIIAAVLILQACKKPSFRNNTPTSGNTDSFIIGKWYWVKSEGGISFQVQTPANTGNQLEIEFKNDGDVNYYKNTVLQYSGSYVIDTAIDPATGSIQQTITQNYFGYYGQPEVQVLHISPGNITFDEGGADRFIHTYEKVKE